MLENNITFDWDNAKVICEKDGYRYLLGPHTSVAMDWLSTIKWCQYVGGELPSKEILKECYENKELRKEFKDFWYWSSTEFDATNAWLQYFNYGFQSTSNKNISFYVRAVRRIPI